MRDDQVALPLVVNMPPIAGPCGRPRTKPKVLQGDAGYGSADLAALVKWLGITPLLAPLGKANPHGSGLGKTRYVVRTHTQFRQLPTTEALLRTLWGALSSLSRTGRSYTLCQAMCQQLKN